jgi:hypothetical protein
VQHGRKAYDELLGVSSPRIPHKLDGFVFVSLEFLPVDSVVECVAATLEEPTLGFLQCGFPIEIGAVSSPQVAPYWLEALDKQHGVLLFTELAPTGCLFSALGQHYSASSSFSFPKTKTGHRTIGPL